MSLTIAPAAFANGHVETDTPFVGWEAIRIIEQDGYPWRFYADDLDADGREELVVVNLRNARLEFVSWRDEPADENEIAVDGVNELPMAPELRRDEFPLKQTPIDVALRDLDGTDGPELYVLVTDPNRLLRVVRDADDTNDRDWKVDERWELLPGRYDGGGTLLQFVTDADGRDTVLISCEDGIQQLQLPEHKNQRTRASWMQPREDLGRNDWWLADLDGDGRADLVEWTDNDEQSIRWYRRAADGTRFLPAQPLHDRSIKDAALLRHPDGADELLILESSPQGMVRRYALGTGEAGAAGRADPLALPGNADAAWAVTAIEGEPTLFALDPEQPRMLRFDFTDAGWTAGESYPVIAEVRAMAALPGESGAIALWPNEGGDLYRTAWTDGRLSFPQPMDLAPDAEKRMIVGMGRVGGTAWCVQSADKDLLLHRWTTDGLTTTVFADAAGKADEARWLGDAGLLLVDKFARGLRHVRLDAETGEAQSTEPAHLSKAKLDEFRAYETAEGVRLARVTDGVLQWLDADLQAQDQVMLPDGLRLVDLAPLQDGEAWALQQGGEALHRLAPDEGGLLRVAATERVADGRELHMDIGLGLLLLTDSGLTRLDEGTPWQLDVVQSIDGRAGGLRDASIHRIAVADLDGDGRDEGLFHDDREHRLAAWTVDEAGELEPLIAWPVFENQSYPYGDSDDDLVREPRRLRALDIDGDGRQDLALFSQDRLLLYLGQAPRSDSQEPKPEDQP